MTNSRWAQAAPLTGVVFVLLFAAGAVLIDNYEFRPPAEEIKSFFEDNSDRVEWGSYLGTLSVAFLLWFVGSLRSSLRAVEGATGRLSAVAFGGGVAAAVLLAAGYSFLGAGASRAGDTDGIAVETATGLLDMYQWLFGAGSVGLAVLIGATAVVAYRTDLLHRWLVWASAVLAVGLLSPYSFIFFGIAILWVLIISILLYIRGRVAGAANTA